ncbi:MAG TPA: hypothetical protein K8V32_11350 [Enteractinococcus helveticum]|uniref:Uncharacterized protein n=1 Tax=Enteractinococcus helveticum TaxID=1837282 RepID=A0A921FPK9_9MICC|nr:hypothetical protein [Enteractinococcus helveticum]HJF15376.1 hypothetical protein [Enteractinococcus helveticum]
MPGTMEDLMISFYQALAAVIRRIRKLVGDVAQHISWSNYHCLDENAAMWAVTFRSYNQQQSIY